MPEFGEKYVPPEAQDFSAEKKEKPDLTERGIRSIQGPAEAPTESAKTEAEPEAVGNPRNRIGPDGKLITTEMTTKYHHPETTKELAPGDGPNPSRSSAPGDTPTDDPTTSADVDDEQNDVPQKQPALDAATRQAIMRRIQGLDQDIAQAEEVKSMTLDEAAQAMKAGDLEKADRATTVAGEADSAVSHMRKEQLDLQRQLETAEEAANQPETPAEPSEAADVPLPDKREMARPSDVEAKEGDRNVEDDMQERNPEHRPLDKEGRLTGRKR